MFVGNWFGKKRSLSQKGQGHTRLQKGVRRKHLAAQNQNRSLRIEELEDRRVLATFIVNTLDDLDGGGNIVTGSLRQAVQLSNASADTTDTIVFADFLFTDPISGVTAPQTISLDGRPQGGELVISDEVNILGPGAGALTIQGGGSNDRIFNINGIGSNAELGAVTIAGVTLSGGDLSAQSAASRGGAIRNSEALTLREVVITDSSAAFGGGAIFNDIGDLTVERSLIQNNSADGGGGGILNGSGGNNPRPSLTVINSTISGNSTGAQEMLPAFGGGIFNRFGTTTINNSTITLNNADSGGGVANYGIPLDAELTVPDITTEISHTIISGNSSDDVFAVRFNIDGDPLRSNLDIQTYNIIGTVGDTVFWSPAVGGNGHFYQVVSVPDGIDYATANLAASTGSGHLATPSSIMENDFIFSLIDDPALWRNFAVDEENAPADGNTQFIGPWIGGIQFDETNGNADGWEWTTLLEVPNAPLPEDEPFADFQNWAQDEPDNGRNLFDPAEPPDPLPEENRLAYFSPESPITANTWGDLPEVPEDEMLPVAYVIEYDTLTNFFGVDPVLLPLDDYAGGTMTFHPDITSPALDAGDPNFDFSGIEFDQRGRHFSRLAGAAIDIGAVEAQSAILRVDSLEDEADFQYSRVWEETDLLTYATFPDYDNTLGVTGGDFTLREALEFSLKNPFINTITFEPLEDSDILLTLDDPVTATSDPTILLTLRDLIDTDTALVINHTVDIIGPESFILEIDATGTDSTPTINNADGSRVFSIDDSDPAFLSDVNISNLTILGGDVLDTGGAIKNLENLSLTSSTVKDSYASNNGGGIFTQFGQLVLDNTTINGNIAGNNGGAIYIDTGIAPGTPVQVAVRNSTVSGNTGVFGAGIFNLNGELDVEFSTITDNVSTIAGAPFAVGAGIGSSSGIDATTQVLSSIVAENMGGDIELLSGATNIQSLGFNLVGDGNASVLFNQTGDLRGVDPMLAPLVNTGGLVATHRLLPGSPAIDAGDSTALPGVNGVPIFDQRGVTFNRVVDGLQDTKVRIDIGAYEAQSIVFTVDTLIDENDGIIAPGSLSLREAIEASNTNPFVDTIMFSPFLAGGTLFTSDLNLLPGTDVTMTISDSVSIIGLGSSLLTIDGTASVGPTGFGVRLFDIDDGDMGNEIDVLISDMRIEDYFLTAGDGGAIKSYENLTIERASFINNSTVQTLVVEDQLPGASYNGGAIFQRYGELTLDNVLLSANRTNALDGDGGAIYVRDADLNILNNSVISGNSTTQALGSGGGVYIRGGTLNMSYSSITSNLAPGGEADGSGLFGYQAVLNIDSSVISGNSMTGSNSEGAGIFSKDSDLNLSTSVVSVNFTTGTQSEGAGLYISGGTASIDNVTLSLNTTSGLDSVGGGIAIVDNAIVEIVDSTLNLNSTSGIGASGGGIHNLSGDLLIRDSTISNSSVSGLNAVGGGIFSDTNLTGTERTTILNSTVSGNSSEEAGGGLFNANGLTSIQHSTVTNNSVPIFGYGAGVASFGDTATLTQVYSSIIAGNSLTDVDRVGGVFNESFLSQGYNVIGTGLSLGAFNAPGDQTNVTNPMIGPLADNGGPTQTHALLVGSPAVNTGDPAFSPASTAPLLTHDQRGTNFGRASGRIDVGAFESLFADFTSDGASSGADFMAWLRGFGTTNANKSDGDADENNVVDGNDLAILLGEYGGVSFESTVVAVAAAQAPESPSSSGSEIQTVALAPLSASRVVAVVASEAPGSEQVDAVPEPATVATTQTIVDPSIEQGRLIPIQSRTRSATLVNLAGLKLGLYPDSLEKDVAFESEQLDGFEFYMASDSSNKIKPGQRSLVELEDLDISLVESEEETQEAGELLFESWGSET